MRGLRKKHKSQQTVASEGNKKLGGRIYHKQCLKKKSKRKQNLGSLHHFIPNMKHDLSYSDHCIFLQLSFVFLSFFKISVRLSSPTYREENIQVVYVAKNSRVCTKRAHTRTHTHGEVSAAAPSINVRLRVWTPHPHTPLPRWFPQQHEPTSARAGVRRGPVPFLLSVCSCKDENELQSLKMTLAFL